MTTACVQLCENLFDIPKRSYAKIKIYISKERIDDYCTNNCGRKNENSEKQFNLLVF